MTRAFTRDLHDSHAKPRTGRCVLTTWHRWRRRTPARLRQPTGRHATGQGVTETKDQKAGAEITALWHYVKGALNA